MPAVRKARWFGSIQILRDGRLRFSPWTFTDLPHVAIKVTDECITVVRAGRAVLFLWPKRNRVLNACFVADLRPDQLREAVLDLRDAGHGLDRWIVPALEWNLAHSHVREDHPETYKIIPELLESCRELPVAEQWERIRANVFANAADAAAAAGKPAEEDTPARKPRRKSRKTTTKRAPRGF